MEYLDICVPFRTTSSLAEERLRDAEEAKMQALAQAAEANKCVHELEILRSKFSVLEMENNDVRILYKINSVLFTDTSTVI